MLQLPLLAADVADELPITSAGAELPPLALSLVDGAGSEPLPLPLPLLLQQLPLHAADVADALAATSSGAELLLLALVLQLANEGYVPLWFEFGAQGLLLQSWLPWLTERTLYTFEARPPFEITAVSRPLPLLGGKYAFASGLALLPDVDKLIVTYGYGDVEARALVMSLTEFNETMFDWCLYNRSA